MKGIIKGTGDNRGEGVTRNWKKFGFHQLLSFFPFLFFLPFVFFFFKL